MTQKPRAFLCATAINHGCPTFSIEGRLLGITVNRSTKDNPQVAVILPATDALEIAEQVKNAKPSATEETKTKEAATPTGEKTPAEK